MHYTSPEVYKHISKQTQDPIVERKICEISSIKFPIFQSDLEFYNKISPTFNDKKYQIPTPKLCPEERQRRRQLFRNDRKLYRRKCDATGEDIVSLYSIDKPYKVYSTKQRWSDRRDPLDYATEINFDKSFNDQFYGLFLNVPQIAIMNDDWVWSENCAYCQDFALWKNCYFAIETGEIEDSMYCHHCNTAKSVVDCDQVISNSSFCYECISSINLYNCKYLQNCTDCSDCTFWNSLNWCSDCFACVGISNKQYCILNKQYTKQEYQKNIENLINTKSKLTVFTQKFQNFVKENIDWNSWFIKNSTLSYGDFLHNCKNVIWLWSFNCEDSKYIINSDRLKNCYDLQARKANYCLEWLTSDDSYNTCFTTRCWKCDNVFYSHNCHNSKDCFACIWLRNKQYCIFNKQYTEQEYNTLVPMLIEKMIQTWERWEFFSPEISPFWYNETVAQEKFPILKQESILKWYKRQTQNYDPIIPKWMQVIKSENYTDQQRNDLKNQNEILKKIFICEQSNRPFRIIKQELDFYKKHNIQLPTKHPDIRHQDRLSLRHF